MFAPLASKNERYRTISYGLKRLAKIEKTIEDKLRHQAKRYNKNYPNEMLHLNIQRLPLLKNELKQQTRDYSFVGVDDSSRELYSRTYPDKSEFSAVQFLQDDVLAQYSYRIECDYLDNKCEYQGSTRASNCQNLL